MRAKYAFATVIIVLMAIIILFELNAPSRFQWDDDSQSYSSKQPFGCYVMDSVLRASLPQGYEVCGKNIDKHLNDTSSSAVKHTFLFTNNHEHFAGTFDVDLLEMVKEGNNVIIAVDHTYYYDYDDPDQDVVVEEEDVYYHDEEVVVAQEDEVEGTTEDNLESEDNLGFTVHETDHNEYYFYTDAIKETLRDHSHNDTINWLGDDRFPAATYLINPAFCSKGLTLSPQYRVIATLSSHPENRSSYYYGQESESPAIVAGARECGKGKIVVTSIPLLFSNYGILNDTIRPIVLRLLSECGDKPVVRYDIRYVGEEVQEETEGSPLHYLLANRPLRWAFYLSLATLVAFVLFSARRRQRVIPVIQPPVNHMMDFVKRIGGIYYKRHDNVDLLYKKYATFSNDLRVKAMIDIDNIDDIDDELQSLSNRTGIPAGQLRQHLNDVREAINSRSIKDARVQQLIDVMNDIMNKINI